MWAVFALVVKQDRLRVDLRFEFILVVAYCGGRLISQSQPVFTGRTVYVAPSAWDDEGGLKVL